ncbi:MAG: bifunctional riboflavin kinase/FAD synthetase [Bacteroidetes bacterium]|nr:bifunctional riboflavin kinase/FAD synthetase [Bacteroidota bacterium]
MVIYRNLDKSHYDRNSIITVGTFDGVHLGHMEIISKVCELKRQGKFRSVVVTFDPHPQLILRNKGHKIQLLSTIEEKIETFEKLGIDVLYILPFTRELAETHAEDFLVKYLVNGIGLSHLVLGFDHSFGKNREGNFETLSSLTGKYGFEVHKVEEFKGDTSINSTTIRKLLLEGDLKHAARLLGYDYSFTGTVVRGDRRGSTIGFPTANVHVEEEHKLIPKNGVYAALAEVEGGIYKGMMNIGHRPTVSSGQDIFIEVNLFDFDKDIYGKRIRVIPKKFIREERKFGSLDELVGQLNKDKTECINFLTK